MKATKIVATIGPASESIETIEAMIRAGADVFRLNFSHGSAEEHTRRAAHVREAARRTGREVAIMGDLQGPKIRVGKFAEGRVYLEPGARFVLDAALDSTAPLGTAEVASLDYKQLPADVRPGDTLVLADGLLSVRVEAIEGTCVVTRVLVGGELSNNKGINKVGGGLSAPALTAKDL
ncbi:MAG: pyruvate kinase, partial [Casimicrobiaceae bacterium]